MEDIYLPNLPDTDHILNPPTTIFYPPLVQEPYLDPLLLPSLEQVQSGLGENRDTTSSEEPSPNEVLENINPEQIPSNLLENQSKISSEAVATFNLPFYGEMPIPSPEVIASSVIAAGTASVVSVAGGIAMQSVLAFIKKTFKKIFTKILKKEVADVKEKIDNNKGS